MKIFADNGVFLGELVNERGNIVYVPSGTTLTEYMLEQALIKVRRNQ